MNEQEKAKRRREIQRGLMVDLMNLQSQANAIDQQMVQWRKKWLAAYKDLDDEMDR